MPKHSLIVHNPAAVLHRESAPVDLEKIGSKEIQTIIKQMSDTLRASPEGIGIAAPQIGCPLRIFVASEEALLIDQAREMTKAERSKRRWKHYVFINPVITNYSRKKYKDMEGCLSVPGKFGTVERSEKVTVEAYNEHGEKFERGASRLFARLMQHEVDHLNGILFISKAKGLVDIEEEKKRKTLKPQ